MNNRRSKIEIIADILRIGPTSKTNIMYQCDIGYHQMQRYLSFLVAHGLMVVENPAPKQKAYQPTAEGKRLLSHIEKVRELLELPDLDA